MTTNFAGLNGATGAPDPLQIGEKRTVNHYFFDKASVTGDGFVEVPQSLGNVAGAGLGIVGNVSIDNLDLAQKLVSSGTLKVEKTCPSGQSRGAYTAGPAARPSCPSGQSRGAYTAGPAARPSTTLPVRIRTGQSARRRPWPLLTEPLAICPGAARPVARPMSSASVSARLANRPTARRPAGYTST